MFFVGKEIHHFCVGVVAEQVALGPTVGVLAHGHHGVDEYGEVGPAGNPIEGILGGWFPGLREMSGRGGGEMTAGGEANDADFLGVELPLLGLGSHRAYGPLCIHQGNEGAAPRQTVLEHHAGHPVSVQPLGDAMTLGSHDLPAITSAGTNDDGRPVGLCRLMEMDPCVLLLELAFPDRGVVVPKGNFLRLGGRMERLDDQECQQGQEYAFYFFHGVT